MSRDTSDRELRASRRKLLEGASVGAMVAVGASGAASAQHTDPGEMAAVEARYDTPGAVRAAVDEHAGRVLDELAARGVLDGGAAAFDYAAVGSDGDGARVMSLWTGDAATAQISLVRETDSHEVTLVVRPELGESYASAKPVDGGGGVTVRDDGGDVGTQGCWTESRCTCDVCDLNSCVYQERTCCDGLSDGVDCGSWSDEGCCGCCCCD